MHSHGSDTCQYWLEQKWEKLEAMKAERHDKAMIVTSTEATSVGVFGIKHSEAKQGRKKIRCLFAYECYKSGVHLAPTLAHGRHSSLAE